MKNRFVDSGSLRLTIPDTDAAGFGFQGPQGGGRLIEGTGLLLAPVIAGKPAACAFDRCETGADGSVRIHCRGDDALAAHVVEIRPQPACGAFDIRCRFTATRNCQLNALAVLPEKTILNLIEVINFRNRHHTARVWPELLLGGDGCETDTTSGDWQFAPHPTMLIFEKLDVRLFIGALDLSRAYGFRFKAQHHRVCHFHLDFGPFPHGLPLAAGETFQSPRFRIFLRHGGTVYDLLDDFAAMQADEGVTPHPSAKPRHPWWTEPLYCTWIDQVFLAATRPPEDLQAQTAEQCVPTRKVLTSAMVREALAVIRREKLPFRTILIDEGWHVARGQWEPHPERFPDFRALVDEIHAAGLKVVVWWNWAEIEKTAKVDPRHLAGGGRLNRHGCRMCDYSLEATRDEYLKPLFRKLFSSEPDCYDLDGVKTDFLADKVHPELPPADPAWRGEENYFRKVYELFYQEMKRWKPDAVHIGCAGNFHLAHLIDINRTYDVHSVNPLEHEERARMLRHTAPGCPVAYDFHNYLENLDEYFASARRLGASLQIGNILLTQEYLFSKPTPADSDYYGLLRRNLRTAEIGPQ